MSHQVSFIFNLKCEPPDLNNLTNLYFLFRQESQFRSNSLNHMSATHTTSKQHSQPDSVDSAAGTSSSSSSSSLSMSAAHLAGTTKHTTETTIVADLKHSFINNNNTTTTTTTNTSSNSSSLRPFYSKLKKTHIFGVKLEKLCGPYHPTANNQLPPQIIVIIKTEIFKCFIYYLQLMVCNLEFNGKSSLRRKHLTDDISKIGEC